MRLRLEVEDHGLQKTQMKAVLIMRGLPGSGKSTIAQSFVKTVPGTVVCSADDFFNGGPINTCMLGWAHSHCQKKFEKALQDGLPLVIVDNTNTTKKEIKVYADKAAEYGYEMTILMVSCDVSTSFQRNRHNVPRETIVTMANSLETSPLDPEWQVMLYSP